MGLKTWKKWTDWPLMVLSVVFLVVYSWEILSRTHIALCETVINVIWVVFVVDYVVSLWLADDRWRWFKHNLFTLLTIALPMLRPLRLLRLLTVLHVLNRTSGMAVRGRITVYAVGAVGMLMYVGALAVYSVERGASGSTITDFGTALWWAFVTVTTVGQNVNPRKTSVVLGDAEKVLYGKGYILDELCGKTYALSPRSFYQINHSQTEVLYGLAVEAAHLTGKEVVLDAYCGIGTIGLTAADHAKQIVGVELNRDAVQDAIGNAKHNGVKNARFFAADATRWISEAAAAGERADVIFMDPPREGSTPQFLDSVARMAPKRVVYVSCNPETLARDLALLTKKGYRVESSTPVDMFPHSEHIETVCLLSKLQSKEF